MEENRENVIQAEKLLSWVQKHWGGISSGMQVLSDEAIADFKEFGPDVTHAQMCELARIIRFSKSVSYGVTPEAYHDAMKVTYDALNSLRH